MIYCIVCKQQLKTAFDREAHVRRHWTPKPQVEVEKHPLKMDDKSGLINLLEEFIGKPGDED